MEDTAVVLITDRNYLKKAEQTIIDIRTLGKWNHTIVLITIDFVVEPNFKDYYNLTTVSFPIINKIELLSKIEEGFIYESIYKLITKIYITRIKKTNNQILEISFIN